MSAPFRSSAWRPEWVQRFRDDRRANIRLAALLVSLLLHGLVFWWGMNSARFGAPSPEKIQAIRVFLQPMEMPELVASARRQSSPSPQAAKPEPRPAVVALPVAAPPPPPAAEPAPAVSPAPAAAVNAPAPAPVAAVSMAPLPFAAVPAAAAGRPPTGDSGVTTGPAISGPAASPATVGPSGAGTVTASPTLAGGTGKAESGLALYKRRLFTHIDAHKIYPAAARRRQLEGQVRVAFTIEPGGGLSNLQVSEGHPQLEEAARQTVQSALPLPLPVEGVELPFKFSFRMDFRLR